MVFDDETEALVWVAGDARAQREIRFHLLTCSLEEVKQHFEATFQKISALRVCGYSPEIIAPYEQALIPILLELRIRGYEADYSGQIYKSAFIVPVPESYPSDRERQKHRLRSLDPDFFRTLYTKTLQTLRSQVKRESKAS